MDLINYKGGGGGIAYVRESLHNRLVRITIPAGIRRLQSLLSLGRSGAQLSSHRQSIIPRMETQHGPLRPGVGCNRRTGTKSPAWP